MQITVPTTNPNNDPIDTIAVWVSGGADSSLLLYLIAKDISERNLNIKVQPYSVRRPRPTHPLFAADVVDWVRDKFANVLSLEVLHCVGDEHQFFNDQAAEGFKSNRFQLLYDGLTQSPPRDVTSTFSDGKNKVSLERETNSTYKEEYFGSHNNITYFIKKPFVHINKKQLAEVYKKEGLLDSLFPLTRSCESNNPSDWHIHCGRCWWCEERMWAFGRLV